jgi:hypothetical protein
MSKVPWVSHGREKCVDHPHRIRSEIECIIPGILIGPGHNRREHRDIGDKEDDP